MVRKYPKKKYPEKLINKNILPKSKSSHQRDDLCLLLKTCGACFFKIKSTIQLVVPQDIRKEEKFQSGDRFIAIAVKDGVLFKRIAIPDARAEFGKLSKEIQKHFKEKGVTKKGVRDAVK